MVAENEEPQPVRRSRPIVWLVGFAAVAAVIVIALPLILAARDHARRLSSGNNLKQIGIGFHNHNDALARLPAGGTFREDETEMHGWPTDIFPYLEGGTLDAYFDKEHPWDDPVQVHTYMQYEFRTYQDPAVAQRTTTDGLRLIHYSANEWLFHRNSHLALDKLKNKDRILLVSEAFGDFVPVGSPFNWRDPNVPLRTSTRQFGSTSRKITLAVMADGSIKELGPTIDVSVMAHLAGPAELRPAPELVKRPTEPYRLKVQDYWRFLYCADADHPKHWKGGSTVRFRSSPDAHYLETRISSLAPASPKSTATWRTEFKSFVKDRPIEHVEIIGELQAYELEAFLEIPTLQRLSLGKALIYGDKKAALDKARKTIEID